MIGSSRYSRGDIQKGSAVLLFPPFIFLERIKFLSKGIVVQKGEEYLLVNNWNKFRNLYTNFVELYPRHHHNTRND